MKFSRSILCNVLLAGSLLGIPAMAATGTTCDASIASRPSTAVPVQGSKACLKGGARKGFMSFSDDQLEKMASLKTQFLDNTAAKREQLFSLKRELKLDLTKPQVDKQQALQVQAQINSVRDDLSNAKLSYRIDRLSVLTPEQREGMRRRTLVSEAFGRMPGRHHFFFRGHRPIEQTKAS